ncbi:ATP-binding protein [Heliorestis convoluta]|uniref:Histidine kinase-like ATPase domain protein n=1 Tax=Heliorestis convoluta TaxID=356322 RepID=A0A5Q2N4V5_9FIRM|nr:ATP-binding protein [Heliorestis convoluta]QGG49341.1 histidine kinase-like ATPase domain protein [Heliorestis convoluta]
MDMIELDLVNRYGELARVHRLIDELGLKNHWDQAVIFQLKLALSEAINNVINHGYGGEGDKPITLRVIVKAEQIEIQIFDQGKSFLIHEREAKTPPPCSESGRGIFLIFHCMDKAHSARRGNWNELTLVKELRKSC